MTSTAEHDTVTTAPAGRAYALIADATRWPLTFAPCLHVDVLERDARQERFRIWVTAGGSVRSWTSHRRFDEQRLRVAFRQEDPAPPFSAVGGEWRFEPAGEGRTRIVLGHDWEVTDPSAETAAWIRQALDRNSDTEVNAVRTWAERDDGLLLCFDDTVEVDGDPAQVYDFLHRADLWPHRIGHVAAVELETTEATAVTGGAEVQTMRMRTSAPDGTDHTTESIRLCFPGRRIVYKQTVLPAPLAGHTGCWEVRRDGNRTLVTVRHGVAVNPDAAGETDRIVAALRTNGLRTLDEARRVVSG